MAPGALIVGSLVESGPEAGGTRGLEALVRLEKVFGRVQSAWLPASGNETYEIVRRRLFQRHRQLVRSGYSDAGESQWHWGLFQTHTTDFRPDLEFLGPGSSVLCGSDVIAAEVEEVIDLIVG